MSGKRTLYLPDDLWAALLQAAADTGAKEGRPVSASEYLRRALVEKIEKDRGGPRE